MTMHAMPVMLGVLAILAIAYRYYSAFLAARVAALDDSRVTPAHRLSDGQNFDPTNRWVLFGHHFAAISGAGPLIGPVLAIQFGYLPGLVWLVVGVCLAGAVQDMMVLAASTRRDGLSLAGLARTEIGRPAGLAAAIAILYIVIIALAGLGIVVVKALGGEEVRMKAGTVLEYPAEFGNQPSVLSRSSDDLPRPRGLDLSLRRRARPDHDHPRSASTWPCPHDRPLKSSPDGRGLVLPENARRLVPGSSWGTFTIACTIPIALFVGWYMYRFRKGKILEASLSGAVAVLAATVGGAFVPGSQLEPYFSLSREATVFALAAYGFVAAVLPVWLLLAPRDYLSTFLKIGTILLLVAGVIVANPKLASAGGQPVLRRGRRALLRRADLPLCLHLHHVRGDLGVSRPGLVGDDAQDDRPRERRPDDRLRRDADGGTGGRGGLDRGGGLAQRDVLRHQHRPGAPARVSGEAPRFRPVSPGGRSRLARRSTPRASKAAASWSRWRRTCKNRSTAAPAGPSRWPSAWPGSSPTPSRA